MRAFTLITVGIISIGVLLLDEYTIRALRGVFKKDHFVNKPLFAKVYRTISALLILGLLFAVLYKLHVGLRAATMMVFFLVFFAKLCLLPFIVADDVRLFFARRRLKNSSPEPQTAPTDTVSAVNSAGDHIPRSEFLIKAGILAAAVPLVPLTRGFISGVYDYQIKRQTLYLPNLPKKFDGIRLGQISDIHSGSFYNKKAVLGGVEMLMREKPDLIFFTGDLVNDRAEEMTGYLDIFSKVKAPLGVYSCLGNHDYGDYSDDWPDAASKEENAKAIRDCHKNMGWDLLRNENRRLKVDGEEIGILGVENWGALSSFAKRGRMDLAVKNTDDLPVKLLLSHDPSHWRSVVLPQYPQIDMVFAGHTHGMQFGVRTNEFKWSPIEYIYPEWAGLYREAAQQIYVNVGYGFLGFSARVGILPEITIFELKAAADPAFDKQA